MAGFARNLREKSNHKGLIWGVYVRPTFRNQGVARGLLKALLDRSKSQPGLEQIILTVAVDQVCGKSACINRSGSRFSGMNGMR